MNKLALSRLSVIEQNAVTLFIKNTREHFPEQILAVALFGSKARGDDDSESDIDLLVITDSESKTLKSTIWRIASEISLDYSVLISPRIYCRKRWKKSNQIGLPFSRGLLSEMIPLTPDQIPI